MPSCVHVTLPWTEHCKQLWNTFNLTQMSLCTNQSEVQTFQVGEQAARAGARAHTRPASWLASMAQRCDFEPGDLEVDTVFFSTFYERQQLPSRDYQLVTSPTAQHWVEGTGDASAAASVAGAIQGLLCCHAANGAAAATLTERDALAVRTSSAASAGQPNAVSPLHSKSLEALPGRGSAAGVQWRSAKLRAEAELKAALGLGAGGSLEELQGALLTAGLAAKLEQRPSDSQLLQVLQRAAGEPELPGSRRLQGSCSQWRCCRALVLTTEAAAAQRPSRRAACMHRRH